MAASGKNTWKSFCSHDPQLTLLQHPTWVTVTAANGKKTWMPFVVMTSNWRLQRPVWVTRTAISGKKTWESLCICGWCSRLLSWTGSLHSPKVAQETDNSLAPKVCVLTVTFFLCPPFCLFFRYAMNWYNKFSMICYIPLVWLTPHLWFCFTLCSLYSCGPGVLFFCLKIYHTQFILLRVNSLTFSLWFYCSQFILMLARSLTFCLWFFLLQFVLMWTKSILFVIFVVHSLYSWWPGCISWL